MDRFRLDGRTVLITGGGGLLGVQHAEAVLEAGGVPVLLDLNQSALDTAAAALAGSHRARVETIACDITSEDHVERAMDDMTRRAGSLDAVINNAAYAGRGEFGRQYFAAFEEYPVEAWRKAVDVNLTGVFIVTRAALRRMVPQRRGVFVNVASDVGIVSPDPRIYDGLPEEQYFNTPPAYSATKAAVINLTRHVATHYARHGIRANAISPAGMYNNQPAAFVERLTKLLPLGRMAERGEHKPSVVYLLSDASSFMTGANLVVDGGRTAW
jgi:NAD(P)-dependent dehydrogenase (short-subunit alcohol dehydrogenase family)